MSLLCPRKARIVFLGGLLLLPAGCSRDHQAQVFTVVKGATARSVAQQLENAKLISSKWLFLVWVKLAGGSNAVRPGVYTFSPDWSGYRTTQQLRKGPPLVRITFPEGWTARHMAGLLEEKGITGGAGFMEIVTKENREGTLFPDTYFFYPGLEPRVVIDRMIHRFHEQAPKDMADRAIAMKLSYKQIVTLASLVEREAQAPEERPIIAGVFYNRLRKKWRLESCATVEYALGKWKSRLSYKDLQVNSPYNTYIHYGLPPGPICNPGKASLEAAAHPAVTDALFFVADGKGTHRFTRYYSEHLEGKKLRKK